jgi:hypothetical protein
MPLAVSCQRHENRHVLIKQSMQVRILLVTKEHQLVKQSQQITLMQQRLELCQKILEGAEVLPLHWVGAHDRLLQ